MTHGHMAENDLSKVILRSLLRVHQAHQALWEAAPLIGDQFPSMECTPAATTRGTGTEQQNWEKNHRINHAGNQCAPRCRYDITL